MVITNPPGGTARLVMLPNESETCRARESIMHMLYETNSWLDKYVKTKPWRAGREIPSALPYMARRRDCGNVNTPFAGATTMNPAVIEAHRAPDPVPADEPTPEPFDNPHPHHPPIHTPQNDDQVPDPNPSVFD